MTFDFQRQFNQFGDISVATALQGKQAEHAEIDRHLSNFLASGKTITVIPTGQSGTIDGVYGALAKRVTKNKRSRTAKLYDDNPEDEQE